MIFLDFEVFKEDWLVTMTDMIRKKEYDIVNDPEMLEFIYKENANGIWSGYNINWYDQYIFKAILCGFDPKRVNDFIIEKGNDGWKFSSMFKQIPMTTFDVMLNNDKGLKLLEGMMGNSIRESSIPFNLDRKLKKDEIEETFKYCRHDTNQAIEVFMRRCDEFNTKMFFIKHFKLPLSDLSRTKPQLAAKILGGNHKGKTFDDEFQFPILDCLDLKKYKFVADWYKDPRNHDYSKAQTEVMIAGVPHNFSWGGGHGAREKYHAIGDFLIVDVTAYYPSLQKRFKFGYRVMDNPENFEFIHDSNIEFKKKGDKKARQPFKIMDNAISGQMKQKSSALYDPMSNNSICINGQLLLLDLVEHLEPHCELVQNNTDGIILRLIDYDKDFEIIDDIVYEWEQRTGMEMGFDAFLNGEIFQKDVNNYLIVDREIGTVKAKGSYVKKLSDLDYDLPIVNKALNDYMVHKIPVEKTIGDCDDLKEFQMVRRISKLYSKILHGGHWESYQAINPASGRMKTFKRFVGERKELKERCVRCFASLDANDGGLWKVKGLDKIEKLEGTPEHSFIYNDEVNGVKVLPKLDKQWYIDLANKRLKDFGAM